MPMTRIWTVDRHFYDAAKQHFGGWPHCMRAAGLVPKPRMTHEDVVAALQYRHRQGLLMTTVWKENVALYGNAKRFFGSWRARCERLAWNRHRVRGIVRKGKLNNGVMQPLREADLIE